MTDFVTPFRRVINISIESLGHITANLALDSTLDFATNLFMIFKKQKNVFFDK